MNWIAWAVIAWQALDVLLTIAMIDRPLEITRGTAVATLVTHGLTIWAVVHLATG